ncbi:hypothetical protein BJX76DRAFT_231816 [Aspergillus varians]
MQHLGLILGLGCAQTAIRVQGVFSGTLALGAFLLLVLPLWLLYICCCPRPLLHTSDQHSRKAFLGQPRLLPTQVSHTRLGTGRYNYTVPHFLVGTPVGLQGHIGRVLSLDEPESRPHTAGPMQYLTPKLESWFTVHGHHHLAKGDDSIGLQGKLHQFLVSQGLDPHEWPAAYLVTMPQFLGYQRNLVCIWYLYSASRELSAMVMEVNNYWGQRKIAFSRLTGEAPLPPSSLSLSPTRIPSGQTSCQFYHSSPRHVTYRGSWDKDMFISPFEKVEGTIALKFSDPLAPNTPLHITITLLSPSGKPRLIGRVFSREEDDPLDPLTASSWSLLRFLPYWTGVLVVTELLIIAAALRIRSKGAPLFSMPEVRPNNLPRDETKSERNLEPSFRAYLKHLVHTSPSPLTLEYIPSKSHHLNPETFTSPSISSNLPSSPPSLTIQVLTPQFYTSFPLYTDPLTAFTHESRPSPLPSDPSSRRLLISDPSLFFTVLSSSSSSLCSSSSSSPPLNTPSKSPLNLKETLISSLRKPNPTSQEEEEEAEEKEEEYEYFLDAFTQRYTPPTHQKAYTSALCAHLLACKFAFGFHQLWDLYMYLGYMLVQVALSGFLFAGVWGRSGLGVAVDAGLAVGLHWGIVKGVDFVGCLLR